MKIGMDCGIKTKRGGGNRGALLGEHPALGFSPGLALRVMCASPVTGCVLGMEPIFKGGVGWEAQRIWFPAERQNESVHGRRWVHASHGRYLNSL